MQKVSTTYKESMESVLRERGYIMVTFGLVNQEAQANAKIDDGDFAYFSNKDNLFKEEETNPNIYATLEENFTKADGTMYFLPRENSGAGILDTGLVGASLVSAAQYELTINLHTDAMDFKGLTVAFGEDYPVDFDLVGSTGQTVEFRNNTESTWNTEEVIENTTYIKLIIYKMKNEHSRLRIYSIMFGYGLVYYNDSVMDSTLEQYVSPISADIPQIDFSVQLKNYDKYFNVDNPDSAINYLETGQEMDVSYGYQLPESGVEWVQGAHLLCSEWESDDETATIRCQDVFRNMTTEYTRGQYNAAGTSYYDLAVDVLSVAGITDYYLDPCLKMLYTTVPMPRVECKQALQIIANACRCVLTQSRNGAVQIKSAFYPDATATANAETGFSNVENVLSDSSKAEYGTMAGDYTTTNAAMYFVPENGEATLNTGFVSEAVSGEDGTFVENPVVTITLASAKSYHGAELRFGSTLPAAFTLHTFNNGAAVEDYKVSDGISAITMVLHDFDDFDVMQIEFTKTAVPYNRIVFNYFTLRNVANFTMTRRDMQSSPKATKQELTKEIVVPCYSYQETTSTETLISEQVTVTEGESETYYLGEASYNFTATLDDSSDGITVIASSSYCVTVKFATAGTYQLTITGNRYKVVEKYVTKTLHNRGNTVKWENPLISNMDMANDLADWLAEYYSANLEYEYNTRGNPEIDATDIVYQENDFVDDMKVTIYRHTIGFKQTFSGQVTARRTGGY